MGARCLVSLRTHNNALRRAPAARAHTRLTLPSAGAHTPPTSRTTHPRRDAGLPRHHHRVQRAAPGRRARRVPPPRAHAAHGDDRVQQPSKRKHVAQQVIRESVDGGDRERGGRRRGGFGGRGGAVGGGGFEQGGRRGALGGGQHGWWGVGGGSPGVAVSFWSAVQRQSCVGARAKKTRHSLVFRFERERGACGPRTPPLLSTVGPLSLSASLYTHTHTHTTMPSSRDARVAAAVDALSLAVAAARSAPPASDKLKATAVAVLTREVPQGAGRWSKVREKRWGRREKNAHRSKRLPFPRVRPPPAQRLSSCMLLKSMHACRGED